MNIRKDLQLVNGAYVNVKSGLRESCTVVAVMEGGGLPSGRHQRSEMIR